MTLDTSRIKALIFDIDGTLSDSDDQLVMGLARLLLPFRFVFHNHDPQPIARKAVFLIESPGNFIYSLPDRFGVDHHLAALGDKLNHWGWGFTPRTFMLIPGVHETLKSLFPHYPMSIVSARGERSTYAFLEQFHLRRYFNEIVTAQTCGHTKPFPDPLVWAAQKLNLTPAECVMIGDTSIDIIAGRAAGAQTVGVLSGFGTEIDLKRAGADLIPPSITGLPNILLM